MLMDWERLPTIQTNRLSLRWISAEDVDDFYAIYSNPEVMRYWSTPSLPDRNAASRLVSEIHEGFKRRELLKWGIALRTDDKLIGSVTLFKPDSTHSRVYIIYALSRSEWGIAYMHRALKALLTYSSSAHVKETQL